MTYPLVGILRPGDQGVDDTLRVMGSMAREAAGTAPFDSRLWWNLTDDEKAHALRAWIARHVRYQDDPPGRELVRHPLQMLASIATAGYAVGDCDDVATLAATLALLMGLEVRFVVVRFRGAETFGHVYAEVKGRAGDSGWVDIDTTRPDALPAGVVIVQTATVGL